MKMRSAQVELLLNHTYILKIPLSIPIGRKCLAMKAVHNVYNNKTKELCLHEYTLFELNVGHAATANKRKYFLLSS